MHLGYGWWGRVVRVRGDVGLMIELRAKWGGRTMGWDNIPDLETCKTFTASLSCALDS